MEKYLKMLHTVWIPL